MQFRRTDKGPNYRRYELIGHNIYGCCVVESYASDSSTSEQKDFPQGKASPENLWHLELMTVMPQRQGYGSLLLEHVRKDVGTSMTVCPVTDESEAFFTKHGMTEKYVLP